MPKGDNTNKFYTEEQVLTAIIGSMGVYNFVAGNLGCSQSAAKDYINKWQSTKKLFLEQEDMVIDHCKSTVFKAIKNNDVGAAKWVLSRLHPEKFSENITVTGNSVIEVKFIFPKDLELEDNEEFKKLVQAASKPK